MRKTRIVDLFKNNIRQYMMIIVLLVIVILFQILTKGILFNAAECCQSYTAERLRNNIGSIGMMLCILTGGNIDLSVGSVVAFTGAIAGSLIIGMKMDVWLAVTITIDRRFYYWCMAGILDCIYQGTCIYRHTCRHAYISGPDKRNTQGSYPCSVSGEIP